MLGTLAYALAAAPCVAVERASALMGRARRHPPWGDAARSRAMMVCRFMDHDLPATHARRGRHRCCYAEASNRFLTVLPTIEPHCDRKRTRADRARRLLHLCLAARISHILARKAPERLMAALRAQAVFRVSEWRLTSVGTYGQCQSLMKSSTILAASMSPASARFTSADMILNALVRSIAYRAIF